MAKITFGISEISKFKKITESLAKDDLFKIQQPIQNLKHAVFERLFSPNEVKAILIFIMNVLPLAHLDYEQKIA